MKGGKWDNAYLEVWCNIKSRKALSEGRMGNGEISHVLGMRGNNVTAKAFQH